MKIQFFSTGGTMDKVYFDAMSTYQIGPPRIDEILKEARINFDYTVTSLMKKDSLNMTDNDRHIILKAVEKAKTRRIIITHGTDTMIQTAKALKPAKEKVIVLTGAMEPAGFKSSDASFNLGCAVSAVQILAPGVYLAISGAIFSPDNAIKNRESKQFKTLD